MKKVASLFCFFVGIGFCNILSASQLALQTDDERTITIINQTGSPVQAVLSPTFNGRKLNLPFTLNPGESREVVLGLRLLDGEKPADFNPPKGVPLRDEKKDPVRWGTLNFREVIAFYAALEQQVLRKSSKDNQEQPAIRTLKSKNAAIVDGATYTVTLRKVNRRKSRSRALQLLQVRS